MVRAPTAELGRAIAVPKAIHPAGEVLAPLKGRGRRQWPLAAVFAGGFHRNRFQSLEFAGGKATFANLADYERMIEVAAKDEGSLNGASIDNNGETTQLPAVLRGVGHRWLPGRRS